jgi:hypothetical protein
MVPDDDPKSVMMQCGSCAGSNYSKCCPTCFDIASAHILQGRLVPNLNHAEQCVRDRESIKSSEMCRVRGTVTTPFLRGELLINAGGKILAPTHVKNDMTYFGDNVNLSHTINELRFGDEAETISNPLSGHQWSQSKHGFFVQRYATHLVPTVVEIGRTVNTVQYSASYSEKEIIKAVSKRHPSIIFSFDTAPISVRSFRSSKTLGEFITSICAIIGGGFTIGGLMDSLLFKVSITKRD